MKFEILVFNKTFISLFLVNKMRISIDLNLNFNLMNQTYIKNNKN